MHGVGPAGGGDLLAVEVPGSGRYAGVPVVMTDLVPDTLVLAFAPRRP
jgi:hypothetical protein